MFDRKRYAKPLKLMISIFICLAAGMFGSFFTSASVDTWYETLNKPSFNPPNWLFAPVWTVLYVVMGISLFLIWSSENAARDRKSTALILFSLQLLLNVVWSVFFFGLKNPFLAFLEIIFLWGTITFTIFSFHKISVSSAYLLLPYLLWVSFASVLNCSIVLLN